MSNFNPRSPHGERLKKIIAELMYKKFQSTLPARGATRANAVRSPCSPHFNPRSPHGERRVVRRECAVLRGISIHAPRTGSDTLSRFTISTFLDFNPRSPHGERRHFRDQERQVQRISIHAPRTGSDRVLTLGEVLEIDFNPRSPHGERQANIVRNIPTKEFQSTLPARGATTWIDGQIEKAIISIHAPRTGSDLVMIPAFQPLIDFNPRSPHGERR